MLFLAVDWPWPTRSNLTDWALLWCQSNINFQFVHQSKYKKYLDSLHSRGGGGGGHGTHFQYIYYLGVVYWSRHPRVFRCLTLFIFLLQLVWCKWNVTLLFAQRSYMSCELSYQNVITCLCFTPWIHFINPFSQTMNCSVLIWYQTYLAGLSATNAILG